MELFKKIKSEGNFIANIGNSQIFTTLNFWTDYWEKLYVIFIELCIKGDILSALKGNNSYKKDNFGIKVGNVEMVY